MKKTLWKMKDKIIVDSDGKPILCDRCPCTTTTTSSSSSSSSSSIDACDIYNIGHTIKLTVYHTIPDAITGECYYEKPMDPFTATRTEDYCRIYKDKNTDKDLVEFLYNATEQQRSFYISYDRYSRKFVSGSENIEYSAPPVVTSLPTTPNCFYGEYIVITSY